MTDKKGYPATSFDARDWAKAFLAAYDENDDGNFLCEEVVTGWFAKALARGYDLGSGGGELDE